MASLIAHTEDSTGAELPQFIKDEFVTFLECGILANVFPRLRCGVSFRGRSAEAVRMGASAMVSLLQPSLPSSFLAGLGPIVGLERGRLNFLCARAKYPWRPPLRPAPTPP